ncbi:hypothetical protein BDR22DRAFT_140510 [Usnea florida]
MRRTPSLIASCSRPSLLTFAPLPPRVRPSGTMSCETGAPKMDEDPSATRSTDVAVTEQVDSVEGEQADSSAVADSSVVADQAKSATPTKTKSKKSKKSAGQQLNPPSADTRQMAKLAGQSNVDTEEPKATTNHPNIEQPINPANGGQKCDKAQSAPPVPPAQSAQYS